MAAAENPDCAIEGVEHAPLFYNAYPLYVIQRRLGAPQLISCADISSLNIMPSSSRREQARVAEHMSVANRNPNVKTLSAGSLPQSTLVIAHCSLAWEMARRAVRLCESVYSKATARRGSLGGCERSGLWGRLVGARSSRGRKRAARRQKSSQSRRAATTTEREVSVSVHLLLHTGTGRTFFLLVVIDRWL